MEEQFKDMMKQGCEAAKEMYDKSEPEQRNLILKLGALVVGFATFVFGITKL